MQGADISQFQPNFPPDWYKQYGFVVCKASEGSSEVDPTFAIKFPAARGNCAHAGTYHYARPADGSGTQQADHFADTCLANGFRPGVDIWMLDVEGTGNESVTAGQWLGYIGEFRIEAEKRLGRLGCLYVGYYFWLSNLGGRHDLLAPWKWWLPWYGPNDGQLHQPTGVNLPQAVFVQQYTSANGLDLNYVDDAAWSTWLQTAPPVDWSAVEKIAKYIELVGEKPLRYGDSGPHVFEMNALLEHCGYHCAGNDFGDATADAIANFKAKFHLHNRDGRVCGRACITALFHHAR